MTEYTRDQHREISNALWRVSTVTSHAGLIGADFDGSDSWGSVMGLWFSICDILSYRGEEIPEEWYYRAGAGRGITPEDEEWPYWASEDESEPSSEYLRTLGYFCQKARDALITIDFDY